VNLTQAIVAVDRSAQHAVYMDVVIGGNGGGHRLYAANFHSGRVEVHDGTFKRIFRANAFVDPRLPPGYAPFGIQDVGGDIVVTFAKRLPGEDVMRNGMFLGRLRGGDGKALRVDGLWGIAFGNGLLHQPTNTLFFAAGVKDEEGGAYGAIKAYGAD